MQASCFAKHNGTSTTTEQCYIKKFAIHGLNIETRHHFTIPQQLLQTAPYKWFRSLTYFNRDSLGYVQDEVHISIVVIVRASRHWNEVVH